MWALGMGEMPPPDADSAQPAPHSPPVPQRRGLVVAGQRGFEPPAALGEILSPDEEHPEVLRRGRAGPRIGAVLGRAIQHIGVAGPAGRAHARRPR